MVASLGGSSAIFRSVLGYFDGKEVVYFQEIVSGSIAPLPIGNNGYHWDTIFVPDGSLKSFAQMGFEEKQHYAPTRKLLEKFEQFVVDQGEK
jgi:XTP/dITP diphosphohydrolase